MTDATLNEAMNIVACGMRATWPDWPRRACVESTIALIAVLRPGIVAVPVWGRVAFFGDYEPHAWAELADGTIVDMTVGQFFRDGEPSRVVRPGDIDFDCYEAEARGDDVIRGTIARMVGLVAEMAR